jgi:hypothetical protein
MNLAPIQLEHGERYGHLTVLEKVKGEYQGWKYRCGCECGNSAFFVRAGALMSGRVKACNRCEERA